MQSKFNQLLEPLSDVSMTFEPHRDYSDPIAAIDALAAQKADLVQQLTTANERIAQLEALAESRRLEIIYLKAERDGATLALANRVERDSI